MEDFKFLEVGVLSDGEIEVAVGEKHPAMLEKGFVPAYWFDIRLAGRPERIGRVDLRIGNTSHLILYGGHIGYSVNTEHRGHRYAARACSLIKPVAVAHGLKTLWITCNPDNIASRRTCEIIGCKLIEIIDLPADTDMYQRGERQKCRYRWDLGELSND